MAKPAPKSAQKKEEKLPANPREWSAAQRREKFLSARKDEDPDFQVKTKEDQEALVPYGFLTFDTVLGLVGIARNGRVSQIHGDEGAGKTTSSYGIAANYQIFTGEPLGVFDFERTGTVRYLEHMGADLSLCKFMQPDSVEDSIKETLRLIAEGCRFFIYDSIPRMKSLVPIKEIMSNKAFKANYGKHAQTMTKFFDLLLPHVAKADGHMMMINQTRDRIEDSLEAQQAQKYPSFANRPYHLPGGRVCRFTPSVMIELKLIREYKPLTPDKADAGKGPAYDPFVMEPATDETEGRPIVNRVRVRTLKDKVMGSGYREGYIWVRPGVGVDENMSVREYARDYGFIGSSGGGKNIKYFVGKDIDSAIVVYPSKEAAIDDLVVSNNPDVHKKLKELLASTIASDTTGRFTGQVTKEEAQYMEGEGDGDAVSSKAFAVDEDDM